MKAVEYFAEELSWINNQQMQEFAISYLNEFPEYFMIKPASSSGRYHPPWSNTTGSDTVPGGLAKHTKALCYMVCELADSESIFEDEFAATLIAALGHDAIKYGVGNEEFTTDTHESEGAEFFRQCLQKYNADIPFADSIYRTIKFHHGVWAKSDPPKVFPDDFDKIGQLVHRADMIVSRTKIAFSFID